ncbi:hypothetical protein KEM60_01703 [Austwickia sp. TVS 96-490-7B]|uniref:Pr6Pr family membrane protein n=1 Tax=Austwickia sp. TVS 96-490-7B TaxID=2830843 RepID=UPI001C562901|nr:Pr6Pr family membrane protein [Austwickia sp. TVS 96-490-7B]MBW3085503.1 hypothetical protein [Austwickia sp. TVS 96-490-7B]
MVFLPSSRHAVIARRIHGVVAITATAGFLAVIILSASGGFLPQPAQPGHLLGTNPEGPAGMWSRVWDTLTYFTVWSNIIVAVAFWVMVARPAHGYVDSPPPLWQRSLLLDALMMITVTAIVYATLIGPSQVLEGWSMLTNPWQHIVVPVVAVAGWVWAGPRRWIDRWAIVGSLLLPMIWTVFMLIRGAAITAYPYAFVDVATHGMGPVAVMIVAIVVFGLLVMASYAGVDLFLQRFSQAPDPQPDLSATDRPDATATR